MSAKSKEVQEAEQSSLQRQIDGLRQQVEALQQSLKMALKSGQRFSGDDSVFLVWVLGFTAGAHLDKSGETGERIFARCRDIYIKQFPGAGCPEGGPS